MSADQHTRFSDGLETDDALLDAFEIVKNVSSLAAAFFDGLQDGLERFRARRKIHVFQPDPEELEVVANTFLDFRVDVLLHDVIEVELDQADALTYLPSY